MKQFIAFVLFFFILSACKVVKNGEVIPTISKTEYSYIDKFHEGLRYKAKGETDFAIEAFTTCFEKKPTDDAVCFALGELYQSKGNVLRAKEFYQKAYEISPENKWYLQEFTYVSFDLEDYKASEKGFKKLLEVEPENFEWLYGYAETLMKKGNYKKAIEALTKTEQQIGGHPQLSIQKFKLYLALRQEKKALNELNQARELFPDEPQIIGTLVDYYFKTKQDSKAIEMLELLAEKDPENGRIHFTLAEIYIQLLKTNAGISEIIKGIECKDVDIDMKMKYLIMILDSKIPMTEEILTLTNLLINQYPDNAKSYSINGDFLMEMRKVSLAIESYRKALKFDNTKFTIWDQVLRLEYLQKDFELLHKDSRNCLELFPNQPIIYLYAGLSAIQLKKYDEAIEVLEVGKELCDKTMQIEFFNYLGEAYFAKKEFNKGEVNFKKALEIYKSSVLILNNYSYQLAINKLDLNYAEEMIKTALQLSPINSNVNDTYGLILFQKGDFEQAKNFFEKANELSKSDATIIEHLGDVYYFIGEKEKALEYWKNAKIVGSKNKVLDQKIEMKKYYEPVYE